MLQVRGLHKSYKLGDIDFPVLKGIDLDVLQGDFVSLMGPSGSGKSTLMHQLGLLDKPDSGDINILGYDMSLMGASERGLLRLHKMGFVFQAFHLMPRLSALANVELPMRLAGDDRVARKERATELLEKVGLGEHIKKRPNQLSGGQKQRVAIARALANDAPILFADEPTGNLDEASTAQVMDILRDLNKEGKTIIQVTHDPDMAKAGNRTIHLRDGRIAGGV